MSDDAKSILNYLAFFILYLVSFYFSHINNTEIVGLGILFIINTSFLLFITGNIFPMLKNANTLMNFNLFSILFGLIIHFISLLFIIIAILHLQQKKANIKGVPVVLPINEKQKLNKFKYFMIISFIIGLLLLFIVFSYEETLNQNNISNIFLNFSSNKLIPLISILFGSSLYIISLLQITPAYNIMLIPKKFISY